MISFKNLEERVGSYAFKVENGILVPTLSDKELYKVSWSWWDRPFFCFSKNNVFLHTIDTTDTCKAYNLLDGKLKIGDLTFRYYIDIYRRKMIDDQRVRLLLRFRPSLKNNPYPSTTPPGRPGSGIFSLTESEANRAWANYNRHAEVAKYGWDAEMSKYKKFYDVINKDFFEYLLASFKDTNLSQQIEKDPFKSHKGFYPHSKINGGTLEIIDFDEFFSFEKYYKRRPDIKIVGSDLELVGKLFSFVYSFLDQISKKDVSRLMSELAGLEKKEYWAQFCKPS